MRIALFHNTSAGSEDHTHDDLRETIERAGHEVVAVSSNVSQLLGTIQAGQCDLVAVAGGDGTVGRLACALAGWQVPAAILALGTANNTARSLFLPVRHTSGVKAWRNSEARLFDLALLDDGVVRTRFAEAVGWGAFPATIIKARKLRERSEPLHTLRRDRRVFQTVAATHEAQPYGISVDGRDHSGRYLMVEITNISYIGPRLCVSPDSNPSDGQLELVLVREQEREALLELARSGEAPAGAFRIVRGRQLEVRAREGVLHQDGELVYHPARLRRFQIRVLPNEMRYLVPPHTKHKSAQTDDPPQSHVDRKLNAALRASRSRTRR